MSLVRLFGSSIVDQALLSAANFAAGLMLIRYAQPTQYGYYVLAFNAMILGTTLQGTFIGTPLIIRIAEVAPLERPGWIGGLLRDQLRWIPVGAAMALLGGVVAWIDGRLSPGGLCVLAATVVLICTALYREYLRGVLMMYQRPMSVLKADFLYVLVLVACVGMVATLPYAATGALLGAAVASWLGATVLRSTLRDDLDSSASAGRLHHLAAMGVWSAAGAAVYWLYTQGYTFLAAATLDVSSVAALAASRLLLMPINLLISGVQKQLTPVASAWLVDIGTSRTLRRLAVFSLMLAAITIVYGIVVWLTRSWIFKDLLHKVYLDSDILLLLWCAVVLMSALREPLTQLLVVRRRFRLLTAITFSCALVALTISYFGMLQLGTWGALLGILVGETVNLLATCWFAWRETNLDRDKPPASSISPI